LPNVGPYIYDVSISGFTRSSIYIYDISSLRVKPVLTERHIVRTLHIANVFGRSPVRKLCGFHIFPELFQVNVGIIPLVRPRPLLSQFIPNSCRRNRLPLSCAFKIPENVPQKSPGALTPDDGLLMCGST